MYLARRFGFLGKRSCVLGDVYLYVLFWPVWFFWPFALVSLFFEAYVGPTFAKTLA
jgi:hypothetical protein